MYMLLSPVLFTACDKEEDDVLPSTVRLSLALPEADLPVYTATRAGDDSIPKFSPKAKTSPYITTHNSARFKQIALTWPNSP